MHMLSKSAVPGVAFLVGAAIVANADPQHRPPPVEGNTEPRFTGTRNLSPRRCGWFGRARPVDITPPAASHRGHLVSGTDASRQGFGRGDHERWANDGNDIREVLAAWVLAALVGAVALSVLGFQEGGHKCAAVVAEEGHCASSLVRETGSAAPQSGSSIAPIQRPVSPESIATFGLAVDGRE